MAVSNITNIGGKEMCIEVVLCTFMHVPSLQPRKKPGGFPAGFPAVRAYM